MSNTFLLSAYLKEMQAEAVATKKCLERIPEKLFEFKPHPTSMKMGYLALLVAEIPLWIAETIESGVIDFATYKSAEPKTTEELVQHFESCMQRAEKAMQNADESQLTGDFSLKNHGQVLFSAPKMENISSSINHWVHHRGQLTVYMRLNEIAVPSIYGPSADEKTF
jgi:uncharacterized damage-inducible protein DinB